MIFWVKGQKGKKWPKITKNYNFYCTPYLIKHTSYMIVIFGTRVKWWHLQMLFSFLQNFDFLGGEEVMGDRRAKNGLKWQNILSLTPYLRNRTSYHCSFRGTYVKWLYLQQFFRFFKILIFRDFRGAGVGLSVILYINISRTISHQVFCYIGVK